MFEAIGFDWVPVVGKRTCLLHSSLIYIIKSEQLSPIYSLPEARKEHSVSEPLYNNAFSFIWSSVNENLLRSEQVCMYSINYVYPWHLVLTFTKRKLQICKMKILHVSFHQHIIQLSMLVRWLQLKSLTCMSPLLLLLALETSRNWSKKKSLEYYKNIKNIRRNGCCFRIICSRR